MLPRKMLPRSHPDGIHIAFDDHHLEPILITRRL